MEVSNLKISFRNQSDRDYEFLLDLYGTTRDDVARFGSHLSREQKADFIESQFKLQSEHYEKTYPKAKFKIIQQSGVDIGRLILNSTSGKTHVIAFAILPKYQSKGIGNSVLGGIIEKAEKKNKIVSIYVAKHNTKARAFYKKLGFTVKEGGTEMHDYMETNSEKTLKVEKSRIGITSIN